MDKAYANLGCAYRDLKIHDMAIKYLEKAIEISPKFFGALYLLGNEY